MQCDRCWKKNPAEVHSCTPYHHYEKIVVLPDCIPDDWWEIIEYETDTTKVKAYKLDNVLYITDMIQI